MYQLQCIFVVAQEISSYMLQGYNKLHWRWCSAFRDISLLVLRCPVLTAPIQWGLLSQGPSWASWRSLGANLGVLRPLYDSMNMSWSVSELHILSKTSWPPIFYFFKIILKHLLFWIFKSLIELNNSNNKKSSSHSDILKSRTRKRTSCNPSVIGNEFLFSSSPFNTIFFPHLLS